MLITTTTTIEGREIEYLGYVDGSVISGVNFVRDIFAGFRDFFGGRAKSYEHVFDAAKQTAMAEMIKNAKDIKADAIIGARIEFETIGAKGSMMMVFATGTAVRFK